MRVAGARTPVRGASGILDGGRGMAGLLGGSSTGASGAVGRSSLPARRNQPLWMPASLRSADRSWPRRNFRR